MEQKENTLREKALNWWKSLDNETRRELTIKYKPNWSKEMVNTSTSTIEYFYIKENM